MVSRVRVSRVRALLKLEWPTCQMPSEWHWPNGRLRLACGGQVRAS